MRSIQSKILLVVITGLLVMTAAVSAIGVSMTHEVMHHDADRILSKMCAKEAETINNMFSEIERSVSIVKHYAQLGVKDTSILLEEQSRETFFTKTKNMFDEIAINTDGAENFYLCIDSVYSDLDFGFYGIVKDGELVKDGIIEKSLSGGVDIRNKHWYQDAVEAGKGIWLQPYLGGSADKTVISYVCPFYGENGLAGVIGIDVDFEKFIASVNEIEVYKEGSAFLLGLDGNTVYNQEQDEVVEKKERPHTFSKMELRNGMTLELLADYEDIQSDTKPMLQEIVKAFLMVLAIFVLLAVYVTHRIVSPLKKLTLAAQNIQDSQGEFDLTIHSKDEIGTLSRVLRETYSKLKEYTNRVNALAYRDSLTGLKNRTAYVEEIEKINQKIVNKEARFAVLVADVNDLKKANDLYGHETGNKLIVHTARILVNAFRRSSVFRIGGDEFVAILEGRDLEEYLELVGKMDEACEEDRIWHEEESFRLGVARGISLFDPKTDRSFDDVFNRADSAMYQHKKLQKAGRA